MNACRPRLLSDSSNELFNFLTDDHHHVGELINNNHDKRQGFQSRRHLVFIFTQRIGPPKRIAYRLTRFDCIFDFTTRSMTDFFLGSDRGDNNTVRLTDVWRKVFAGIFKEFSDTKFVLHHKHDNLKIPKLDNMEVIVHSKKKK